VFAIEDKNSISTAVSCNAGTRVCTVDADKVTEAMVADYKITMTAKGTNNAVL
jgi:hypothetical protein